MRYLSSLMLFGLFAIGCRGLASGHQQGFYSYDRKTVVAFLKANHLQGSPVWIKRNTTGEKLYVFLYDKAHPGEHRVVIVRTNAISVSVVPGIIAFFHESDEVVAWSNDLKQGITFKNQFILHRPRFARFDVDPSGKHFIVGEKPNKTWLGDVDQPEVSMLIATNFLGRRIFSTIDGLVIAGSRYLDGEYTSSCLFIKRGEEDNRFTVTKTLDFPSFSGVIDVSADGRALVLQRKSDLFAGWHLYDLSTGKSRRLRVAARFGFFLNADLLAVDK